jgi:hypothetical protein
VTGELEVALAVTRSSAVEEVDAGSEAPEEEGRVVDGRGRI